MPVSTVEKTSLIVEKVIPYAEKLFRKYGYKKTTVDEIASGVHISKKTLYEVFPSKEAILREMAWRDTIEVMHVFNDTVPSGTQTDKMLLALCRFIFTDRIKQGKTGYFWGFYIDDSTINNASYDALKRIIKKIYEDGSRKGLFKPVESFIATEVIINMMKAALKNFHLSKEPLQMFNNSLNMIADAVAYKNRILFDTLV